MTWYDITHRQLCSIAHEPVPSLLRIWSSPFSTGCMLARSTLSRCCTVELDRGVCIFACCIAKAVLDKYPNSVDSLCKRGRGEEHSNAPAGTIHEGPGHMAEQEFIQGWAICKSRQGSGSFMCAGRFQGSMALKAGIYALHFKEASCHARNHASQG